jgi:hypothetical protein
MGAARSTRAIRAWRGLAAAAFATFVAALSHSAALGELAPLIGVVLAFTVAAPVCVVLAGRGMSWLRLSVAVVLSQAAFHGLLMIGVGGATSSVLAPAGPHGTHTALLEASTTAAHTMSAHTDAWMWIAHAAAAALTVLAFGKGEQAVRSLLALFARRLIAWRGVTLPTPVRAPRVYGFGRLLAAPGLVLLSVVRRRGPPLAA